MQELQIFKNENFGEIRTVEVNKEIYFVGKDVADILGYAKPENAIATHVDEEDKTSTLIQGTGSNYKSKAVIINESGLYSLVLSSKLPTAKQFKRWVTSEVLPTIRKTGSYSVKNNNQEAQISRAKAMELNAKVRVANLFLKIADRVNILEYKNIMNSKAAETLAGEPILPLPKVQRKTYSATDIGQMFGVSANAIGKTANANNLKTPEYGQLFYDKSRHSCKEVETWRYYDNVIPVFEKLLKMGVSA